MARPDRYFSNASQGQLDDLMHKHLMRCAWPDNPQTRRAVSGLSYATAAAFMSGRWNRRENRPLNNGQHICANRISIMFGLIFCHHFIVSSFDHNTLISKQRNASLSHAHCASGAKYRHTTLRPFNCQFISLPLNGSTFPSTPSLPIPLTLLPAALLPRETGR